MFNPLGYLPHLIRNTWSLDILGEELVLGKWHGKKPSEVKLIYSKKQLCPRLTCCSGHWLNWGLQLGIGKRERGGGRVEWESCRWVTRVWTTPPHPSVHRKCFSSKQPITKGLNFLGSSALQCSEAPSFSQKRGWQRDKVISRTGDDLITLPNLT